MIVPNCGLALIGKLLAATKIAKRADSLALPRKPRPEVLHSDVLLSMIGLLCLGKSDFGDITPFYENPFFAKALGLRAVPSEPTLRQRMELFEDLPQSFHCFVPGYRPQFRGAECGSKRKICVQARAVA